MRIGENITLKSLEELSIVAKKIIKDLNLDEESNLVSCLAFYGEMGAGKTTLIKEICKELGVDDTTSSPTFSIVNEYVINIQRSIFHFDFYRLNAESEAYDFGYEEYFYSGELCMIEWPEKIERLLPLPHYKIVILLDENDNRTIQLSKDT